MHIHAKRYLRAAVGKHPRHPVVFDGEHADGKIDKKVRIVEAAFDINDWVSDEQVGGGFLTQLSDGWIKLHHSR